MIAGLKEVRLWCVLGISQIKYDNKLRAERAARLAFPDEDADKRYSRVHFKTFYEEDVNGIEAKIEQRRAIIRNHASECNIVLDSECNIISPCTCTK